MALMQGDLDDMILNKITIDMFKPKLEQDNIVVSFEVTDPDVGVDLRYFIDRGDYHVLDTEISLYPNLNGYYYLLIEYNRDQNFPNYLCKLLKYIKKLSNMENWIFEPYIYNVTKVVNIPNLRKYIRLKKLDNNIIEQERNLIRFFKNYVVKIDGNIITIKTDKGDKKFKFMGETSDELIERLVYEDEIDLLSLEKINPLFISDDYHIINLGKYIAIKNTILDKTFLFEIV